MNICLDTNRYADLISGDAVTVEIVRQAGVIALPFVVLAELWQALGPE